MPRLSLLTSHIPCGSAGKESTCNAGDLGWIPGLRRSPGERLPTPVFWPGEFHGLYNPWGPKRWTWLSDFDFHILQPRAHFLKKNWRFSSVAESCPTVCNPMDGSTPGLPVHHQLPEFTQAHIHWVSDTIQPSHPLLPPSPALVVNVGICIKQYICYLWKLGFIGSVLSLTGLFLTLQWSLYYFWSTEKMVIASIDQWGNPIHTEKASVFWQAKCIQVFKACVCLPQGT